MSDDMHKHVQALRKAEERLRIAQVARPVADKIAARSRTLAPRATGALAASIYAKITTGERKWDKRNFCKVRVWGGVPYAYFQKVDYFRSAATPELEEELREAVAREFQRVVIDVG